MDNIQQTQISFICSKYVISENKIKTFLIQQNQFANQPLGIVFTALEKIYFCKKYQILAITLVIKTAHKVIYAIFSLKK